MSQQEGPPVSELLTPLVSGSPCAVAVAVIVHLPPVHRRLEAAWTSGSGFHY